MVIQALFAMHIQKYITFLGVILFYCQQIPLEDQNQQRVSPSHITL